jgi:hypothetical protein
MRRWLVFSSGVIAIVLAWPHLFFRGQIPVDANIIRGFYPNWAFLHGHSPTLWKGPLWNPYRDMGEPFFADPQTLAAYPPMWFLCRLSSYLEFTRCWVIIHSLLAAYFMRAWVMRATGDPVAGLAAAVVAAFNGYWMAHVTFPNHFAAAAYIPAIFYFFETRNVYGLAGSFAMQWLAGFPPFSFVTGLALLVWCFFDDSSSWSLYGRAALLALGLAAFQVIPFLEFFLHSSRALILKLPGALQFSEPAAQLMRMLFIPQWFVWHPQLMGDQAIVSFYAGPIVLALAVWGALRGSKREWIFTAIVLASFVLSLGKGFEQIALLRVIRFPANWLVVASIGLAFLCGSGVAKIRSRGVKWVVFALVAGDLLAFSQHVRVAWFEPAFLSKPPILATTITPSAAWSRIYHPRAFVDRLATQTLHAEADYDFLKESLQPSSAMAFEIPEVDSYQSIRLSRADAYQTRLASEGPSSPLLEWAGVSTVITRKLDGEPWNVDNMLIVQTRTHKPELFFAGSSDAENPRVTSYSPGHIEADVHALHPDLLVFSEVAYPGWEVYVDGHKGQTDLFQDTFLAIRTPPGRHHVTFDYNPISFRLGLLVTAVFLAIFLSGILKVALPISA